MFTSYALLYFDSFSRCWILGSSSLCLIRQMNSIMGYGLYRQQVWSLPSSAKSCILNFLKFQMTPISYILPDLLQKFIMLNYELNAKPVFGNATIDQLIDDYTKKYDQKFSKKQQLKFYDTTIQALPPQKHLQMLKNKVRKSLSKERKDQSLINEDRKQSSKVRVKALKTTSYLKPSSKKSKWKKLFIQTVQLIIIKKRGFRRLYLNFQQIIETTYKIPVLSYDRKQSLQLFTAVQKGKRYVVQQMLKSDPELVKQIDRNRLSLLHVACKRGDVQIVKEILKSNPDLQVEDSFGQTPLCIAIVNKNFEITFQLLMAGASPFIFYKNKLNPIVNHQSLAAAKYMMMLYTGSQFILESGERGVKRDQNARKREFIRSRKAILLEMSKQKLKNLFMSSLKEH